MAEEKITETIEETKKEAPKVLEASKIRGDKDSKKKSEKKDKKSKEEIRIEPKTEAVVNAKNLPISTKHSIAICNMIRNKDIDWAI